MVRFSIRGLRIGPVTTNDGIASPLPAFVTEMLAVAPTNSVKSSGKLSGKLNPACAAALAATVSEWRAWLTTRGSAATIATRKFLGRRPVIRVGDCRRSDTCRPTPPDSCHLRVASARSASVARRSLSTRELRIVGVIPSTCTNPSSVTGRRPA